MRFFQDQEHPWVRSQHFENTFISKLLERSQSAAYNGQTPKTPTWVLDLDSTLFCTGLRTRNIFGEFLRSHPQPKILWHLAWTQMGALNQRYSIPHGLGLALRPFVSNDIEARQEALAIWAEFQNFWIQRFFSDRHIHFDEPYPGAVDFVRQIRAIGHDVVYLTGRDRARCQAGTISSLKRWNFPIDGQTHLFLKPDMTLSDVDYKERAASVIRSRFDARIFLDNEPENLVMFAREFPNADIVFFHTVMSSRLPDKNYAETLKGRPAYRLNHF